MNNLLLKPIDWTAFGIVVGIVSALAIIFALLIVLVSKLCAVKEDERVVAVQERLAGANCGGCGFAGCADFAKALVEGKADICKCGATSNEDKSEIAKILGVDFDGQEPLFAVVNCCGGNNAKDKFNYVGNTECYAQITMQGGQKVCSQGCLGGGTCITACTNDAIKVINGVAVINKVLCGGCGACVQKCPKNVISLIPRSARVYVGCNSKCKGKQAMESCSVSCIGCGLCAKSCPQNAVTMVDNIPVIDYSKCNGCKTCMSKCPRKCIKEI